VDAKARKKYKEEKCKQIGLVKLKGKGNAGTDDGICDGLPGIDGKVLWKDLGLDPKKKCETERDSWGAVGMFTAAVAKGTGEKQVANDGTHSLG
jgi:hypothetical protein